MAVRVEILGSGSRGNCTFVHGGRTRILIDAGLSATEIRRRLALIGERPEDLDAILVTHDHSDHVGGVPVLSRRCRVPVACHADIRNAAGLGEGAVVEWLPVEAGGSFSVGDLEVEAFEVPHDATMTMGFRVRAEGLAIGYCTDLGHVTRLVRERLRGCQVLVLESNHDLEMLREGPYPWALKQRVGGRHGHLSNDAASGLLEEIGGGELLALALAHLSETNNAPELAMIGARAALERAGRSTFPLVAASQDHVTHVALA